MKVLLEKINSLSLTVSAAQFDLVTSKDPVDTHLIAQSFEKINRVFVDVLVECNRLALFPDIAHQALADGWTELALED